MAFVKPVHKFATKGSDNPVFNRVYFSDGFLIAITPDSMYFSSIEETTEFSPELIDQLNGWSLTMEAWQLLEKAQSVELEMIDKILHASFHLKTYVAETEMESIPDDVRSLIRKYGSYLVDTEFYPNKLAAVESLDLKAFLDVSKCVNPYIGRIAVDSFIWVVANSDASHVMVTLRNVDDPIFLQDELKVAGQILAHV